ncbi:uncharacterized protein ColSpa_09971 [Colletotrichum spaethianum]|uniref:Uncharacterized protein n=1 Tax=Colletotrichum spaethianum TaxID=700344 RepID=A0AA37PCL2_9PEZI|nr:uncharacterized protein ColSpa_09971 [Colletotrichum spaethianum]GKT49790.1 hypothetical protein ColSpa_09971 [Colletotrichum spaethianum]
MTIESERELSPSDFTPSATTPWPTGMPLRYGGAESGSSRRGSVESRTGGVPETPVGTPVGDLFTVGLAMAMGKRTGTMREMIEMDESDMSTRSPASFGLSRWRGGGRGSLRRMPNLESRFIGRSVCADEMTDARGQFGRIVEIVDETEDIEHTTSDGNGSVQVVFERVFEVDNETEEAVAQTVSRPSKVEKRVTAAKKCGFRDGGDHVQPISWWNYPWFVLMLVLFMLFVPSFKEII